MRQLLNGILVALVVSGGAAFAQTVSAPGSTQTGAGAGAGAAAETMTLSSDETAKLRSSMRNVSIKEVTINVEAKTGMVLPASVELEAVPAQFVEIVPRFRNYRAVHVKGQVLIVEPATRRIVYVIQG